MGKPNPPAKEELKRGPWTREEDQKLLAYIEEHGHGSWRSLPAKTGLQRCGKSCRLRWTNYLRPDIKRGKFSSHEEKTIIRLHALLGNRWSAIAAHLPKRTDNEIKNLWNTRLKKKLTRMGIDPATHKPKSSSGGAAQSRQAANLSHMAQWETARLEAEARLVRESKILSNLQFLQRVIIPPPPLPATPFQMTTAAPPCLDVLKVWQATATTVNNCFLGTPTTTLESPTSTLNFSAGSAVTAVPTLTAAPGCGIDNYIAAFEMDYGWFNVADAAEIGVQSNGSDSYNMSAAASAAFVEQDDTKSYWNELLNMVTSPMELPGF